MISAELLFSSIAFFVHAAMSATIHQLQHGKRSPRFSMELVGLMVWRLPPSSWSLCGVIAG